MFYKIKILLLPVTKQTILPEKIFYLMWYLSIFVSYLKGIEVT